MDEFELIDRWLRELPTAGSGVRLGPGDDAAVLAPSRGAHLVVTTDTVVDGVHFLRERFPPSAVGHKALAVNLSDLAAMGARPRWVTVALALSVETARWRWLKEVARGFGRLARAHGVVVVGGNVTKAPVFSVTVTALGEGRDLLRRDGARPGDRIVVTGTLGDAALGLERLRRRSGVPRRLDRLESRQARPTPRVAMGRAAVGVASAAIDVSDGFVADLTHLLRASGVGATVYCERLPLSRAYRRARTDRLPALTGGEDYELCLTVPPAALPLLERRARAAGTPLTEVGVVEEREGIRLLDARGRPIELGRAGWRHDLATARRRARRRP